MRRSWRFILTIGLGSLPCLVAAYPAAMRLQACCDLTSNQMRAVLAGFLLAAAALPVFSLVLPRTLRRPRMRLCRHCEHDLTDHIGNTCPACGTPCKPASSLSNRPLVVLKTVCTLCSTTVNVPLDARGWARCPNCGALVPV